MSDGATAKPPASIQAASLQPASVHVIGTAADRRALGAAWRRKGPAGGRLPVIAAALVFGLMVTFGRDALVRAGVEFGTAATYAAIAGLILFLLIVLGAQRARATRSIDPRGIFARGFNLTAEESGLHLVGEFSESRYRWPAILRFEETGSHFFLYIDGAQAIIVPKRCFASSEDAVRFAATVRAGLAH
jgi:hypothetical protein